MSRSGWCDRKCICVSVMTWFPQTSMNTRPHSYCRFGASLKIRSFAILTDREKCSKSMRAQSFAADKRKSLTSIPTEHVKSISAIEPNDVVWSNFLLANIRPITVADETRLWFPGVAA